MFRCENRLHGLEKALEKRVAALETVELVASIEMSSTVSCKGFCGVQLKPAELPFNETKVVMVVGMLKTRIGNHNPKQRYATLQYFAKNAVGSEDLSHYANCFEAFRRLAEELKMESA